MEKEMAKQEIGREKNNIIQFINGNVKINKWN